MFPGRVLLMHYKNDSMLHSISAAHLQSIKNN